jgi:hypothetical protein
LRDATNVSNEMMTPNNFKTKQQISNRKEKIQFQEARTYLNNYRADNQVVNKELERKKESVERDRYNTQKAKEFLHRYKAEDYSTVRTEYYKNQHQNQISSSQMSPPVCYTSRRRTTMAINTNANATNNYGKSKSWNGNSNENINANEEWILSSSLNAGDCFLYHSHDHNQNSNNNVAGSKIRKVANGQNNEDNDPKGLCYCDDLKPSMTMETESTNVTDVSSSETRHDGTTVFSFHDSGKYEIIDNSENNSSGRPQQEILLGCDEAFDIRGQREREGEDCNRHFTTTLKGLQSSANFDETNEDKYNSSYNQIFDIRGQMERECEDYNHHFTTTLQGLQSSANFDETNEDEYNSSYYRVSMDKYLNVNGPYHDDNTCIENQKRDNEHSLLIGKLEKEKECFACTIM